MASTPRGKLSILAVGLSLFLIISYIHLGSTRDTWEEAAELSVGRLSQGSDDVDESWEGTTTTNSEAPESTATQPFAFFADESAPSEPPPPPKPRYAIVTSVWEPNYASLALGLGWTIKQHNPIAELGIELILLTLNNDSDGAAGLTVENATRLEKVGWQIRVEPRLVAPGVDMSKIMRHRRLNLNKLKIFGWAEYEKIVFMDADTACKGPLDELFQMPGEFAASPDSWMNIEIDSRFNSGLMVLKPSRWLFSDMLDKLADPHYHDPREGDQAFLQNYWRYKNFGLPTKYNLNLVMFEHHRKGWDRVWMTTSVVHYTVRKPREAWKGHCKQPKSETPNKGCREWMPLVWYAEQFEKMRTELGFQNEIGLLG